MLILKYSYLDRDRHLVKLLVKGKYGIYSLAQAKLVAEPAFDLLQYHSRKDSIWAKKDGFYFLIDHAGNRLGDVSVSEDEWMFVDKNDRCPSCNGACCSDCHGFGIVPFKGDYSGYFDD